MAYPNYPETGKIRQGGDSWLQLFLQKDQNTPVKDIEIGDVPRLPVAFAIDTAYARGDLVEDSSNVYLVKTAIPDTNKSAASELVTAGNLEKIRDAYATFAVSTAYAAGAFIKDADGVYLVKKPILASNTDAVADLISAGSLTKVPDRPANEKVSRQFTRFGFDVDGDRLNSGAIKGSRDRSRGQSGQRWAAGPIESELLMSHMLTYIQGGLAAPRDTASTDIADTDVTAPGGVSVTPDSENYARTVGKASVVPAPEFVVANHPSDPGSAADVSISKQLEITVTAPSGESIPANYWVRVSGLRKTGLGPYDKELISEVAVQETAGQTLTKTISADDYSFDEITELVFKEPVTNSSNVNQALTVVITAKTTQKKTVFHETLDIFDGWSLIGSTGGQPRLGYGVIPTTMTIRLGDIADIAMETQTGLGWRKRTIVGGYLEERENFALDAEADASKRDTTHPDYASGYPYIENVFYPGKLGALEITQGSETRAIVFNNAEIAINNAVEFIEGRTGSPHRGNQVSADADRTFDVSFSEYIEDPAFVDWETLFFEGETISVTAWVFYWNAKGKQYYHRITFGNCQVGEISQQTVDNKGSLQQTLPLEVIKEGTENLIRWEILDDHGWEEPTYSD